MSPDGGLKTSETAWEGKAGESEAWDGGVGPCQACRRVGGLTTYTAQIG